MDEATVLQIVDEVLSSLEPLDTQSAALVQFLKAKGIVSDEELAPFMEQAGNASNVRWLAARVRIKSLISSAIKTEEPKPFEAPAEQEQTSRESAQEKKGTTSGKIDEADDRKDKKGRDPEPKTKGSSAQEKETSGQDREAQKTDDPKPVKANDAKSDKDEMKAGQTVPSKSDVKENAA